jgi:hypothetical protein
MRHRLREHRHMAPHVLGALDLRVRCKRADAQHAAVEPDLCEPR